jgi:RNA polymerase sigma factor (sigma-70 family)
MPRDSLDPVLVHIRKLGRVQVRRELDDRELLEQFVTAKDEEAFRVLVERHGPGVASVCRRALGHTEDAEDACQACFLVLAQKAGSIRKRTSLSSWLRSVASRVAAKVKRDGARRSRRERKSQKAAMADAAAEISWREVQAALDEELQRLPERLRAPLILCYLDGRTREEAAQQLGLTLACLHGRLERGRKVLCDRLTRRGVTLSATLTAVLLGQGVARASLPGSVVRSRLPWPSPPDVRLREALFPPRFSHSLGRL